MEDNIHTEVMYCQNNDIISTNLDGERVMMSVECGHYYGIDSVGNDLWQYLEEPRSLLDICRHMMSKYAVERSTCEEDMKDFLQQMINEKLIEVRYRSQNL